MDADVVNSMELENEYDAEFTLAEILEMENIYKEKGEKFINQQFCEELATKFSSSLYRHGKSFIKGQQVHSWFQDTIMAREIKISSLKQQPEKPIDKSATFGSVSLYNKRLGALMQKRVQEYAFKSPQKPIDERISDLSELVFEAKSAKDFAWYDVAAFINYRITSSAELEVRVRFAGFDKDDDEWVNVKWGVRQRSIPLEPSECDRVKVGDLVLCFRVEENHEVYCDAYVEEIERKSHDSEDCKCSFLVRYDYDDLEDKVQLSRLCCRPT